jgi:Caspase domain
MKKSAAGLLLIFMMAGVSNGRPPADSGVFVLEVPEANLQVRENATVAVPNSYIGKLKVRVLRSSQEVSPGKILVRINGEAANTIMETRAAESTIICDLNLYFRPGFLLHAGRNTVEASGESIYGRIYYAAFLLDVRDEPDQSREIQRETTVAVSGETPPIIRLLRPEGPIENQHQVWLEGSVEGGVSPVSLTVQDQPTTLSATPVPSGTRGIQLGTEEVRNFSIKVSLRAEQDSVQLAARDAHKNQMKLVIPVFQGTRNAAHRYAVVIGISRYQDVRIPGLQFADKDAEAVRDFLQDPNGGGVPIANMRFLENEDATYDRIRNALFDFLTAPQPDDLAIVYFAGHGANDRIRPDNYYLLGYDSKASKIASTGVPMWQIQDLFNRTLQSNAVVLVDACHSAAIENLGLNLTNQRWTMISQGSTRRAVITASKTAEFSNEDARWGGGHGVFTWFVLRGLRGEADFNHDHQVSVGELFRFVHDRVPEETQHSQTPTALPGSATSLVLTQGTTKAEWNRPLLIPLVYEEYRHD